MTTPSSPFGADQQVPAPAGQGADFYLQNYRLGKTLGIGSFGKVQLIAQAAATIGTIGHLR